jgi:hypothetical protein
MAWWKDWLKRGGARPLRSNADDKAPKLSPVFLSNITAPQTQEPESQSGKLNNGAFSQKSTGPGDALRKEPQADHGAQDLRAFFQHDGVLVAFELNWQLLRDGQMRKQQAKALADGYTHQVIGVEGDLAGFIDLKRGTRDKRTMYSAALLIAEASSLSGDEVFVFRLDDTRHAMVALKNSMPVPGFDLVGSTEAISQAVQSYFSLPHKNEIRRCGDAAVLSGAEFFDFSAVLNSLDPSQPRISRSLTFARFSITPHWPLALDCCCCSHGVDGRILKPKLKPNACSAIVIRI